MSAVPRQDGRRLFLGSFAKACRPRKRLTVSQWADAHRVLSSKSSSEAGDWKTSRTPYLREIMDCLSVHSKVQRVVVMKASQLGLTALALNWIGYMMEHDPGPILVVVPTDKLLEEWVAQELNPLLTETTRLAALVSNRPRDAANRKDLREFPGGLLMLMGANSPDNFRQKKAKYLIGDDIDAYPLEVGDEGDPIGLLARRQATFHRRKALLISTPTIKDASRIDQEYERSDKRHYHMPCPHCGEYQALSWRNLMYTKHPVTQLVTDAWYVCAHNGCMIRESEKPGMLAAGRWIPEHPERPVRGYHINGLYAPLGLGYRWIELAQEWVNAQDDRAALKRFVNTVLGETWEDERLKKVNHQTLAERAEPYNLREIPPGCLILTCGVDVQGDRVELQVLGHGRGRVTWTIDVLVIPGDPTRDEMWNKLTAYLVQPFANRFGRELRIDATAIDTGGQNTQDVYNYVRCVKDLPVAERPRRVMAIKGSNTPSKPILAGRPSPQDMNHRGKYVKRGVLLWTIGTDTAKELLTQRLKGDENHQVDDRLVRFSNALPEDYYLQLTSEVFDPERNRWVKRRGRRNEALDTWVYGTAAAYHPEVRVYAKSARDWERLEQLLEPAEDAASDSAADLAPPRPSSEKPSPLKPIRADDPYL